MARKSADRVPAALEQAQQLVYDAWEAKTVKDRLALARKALAISPLCADAYVLLAEHVLQGSDEQLELWRRGVNAGEQALGGDGFEKYAGRFWGSWRPDPICARGSVWRGRFGTAVRMARPSIIFAICCG
jgi:hypothetical protein